MRREAKIYAVYALVGGWLFLYATSVSIKAWERFGVSSTFAVYFCTTLTIAILTVFCAWLAFIFYARSLAYLHHVPGGFELLPAKHLTHQPIQVQRLRHIRTVGKQFAKDETAPAYSILAADGRVWVADASSYQAANAGAER